MRNDDNRFENLPWIPNSADLSAEMAIASPHHWLEGSPFPPSTFDFPTFTLGMPSDAPLQRGGSRVRGIRAPKEAAYPTLAYLPTFPHRPTAPLLLCNNEGR
ncbi:MAG: hypothetical protein ACQKBT_09230 [Puniceicoccales bacterium]